MALTYNLKYKKLNFFSKVLLEKEGEIVIDRQCFRLKGKGAGDMGEMIYFSDLKELVIEGEVLRLSTYRRERFELSHFSSLFASFLKDFFRVRNEWLAESLQMKVGMLYHEYEANIDIINRFGKHISRGKSRLQFYEGSLLIIPEVHDCFVVYYNFLKHHEFDEDEYTLKLTLDSGSVIEISKFATAFEDMRETLESLLGKMYEKLVGQLQEFFPDIQAGSLIKLSALLREGKCIPFNSLKKIDAELPSQVDALVFGKSSAALPEKVQFLRSISEDGEFFVAFHFSPQPGHELKVKSWFALALPHENLVALGETSDPSQETIYFFRLPDEIGDSSESIKTKILEINQSLYLAKFDFSPLYRDSFELKKSKFRLLLRKVLFLRLLRKSYLGKIFAGDLTTFQKESQRIMALAKKKQNIGQIASNPLQ